MVRKDQFYFGTLLKVIDFYAFPRTGNHLFMYSFSGLYDMVMTMPQELLEHREGISRQEEVRDLALYGLDLREQGAPFAPVWLNPIKDEGFHRTPAAGDNPILILIRNPFAAAYSAWRARKRLALAVESPAEMRAHLDWYENFYDAAMNLVGNARAGAMLVRYEDLIAGAHELERVVEFVGLRPKLSPQFVHWITRFDNFVKPGERSFFRGGGDDAWRESAEFGRLVTAGPPRDFRRFGYNVDFAALAR